ncbi:uncharacterized protein [Clytia hemisphaerica]|uniref:Uncharacterized protein n=1 Tax=Clytia hemisphaerica TaxID=252671 RepID=A0A7M5XDQ0_9CNID|eukprot:TCONS_00050935-protein
MEHTRRHSVPILTSFDLVTTTTSTTTIFNCAAKDKLQFYTPQHDHSIRKSYASYKDLANAPIKKERPRITRRSSVPCLSSERSRHNSLKVICKRLDFSAETTTPSNKRHHPDTSFKTPSSMATAKTSTTLNDVFADLRVDRIQPPSKRVRFSDDVKVACPLATTPISNLRTPTSGRSRLQNSHLYTPLSRLRHQRTPVRQTPVQNVTPLKSGTTSALAALSASRVRFQNTSAINAPVSMPDSKNNWFFKPSAAKKPQLFVQSSRTTPMKLPNSANTLASKKPSENLFKKTLQSTRAAKELDLLLK